MIRKLGATNLILIANVLKIDNKLSVDKTDHEVSDFKFQAYVAILACPECCLGQVPMMCIVKIRLRNTVYGYS